MRPPVSNIFIVLYHYSVNGEYLGLIQNTSIDALTECITNPLVNGCPLCAARCQPKDNGNDGDVIPNANLTSTAKQEYCYIIPKNPEDKEIEHFKVANNNHVACLSGNCKESPEEYSRCLKKGENFRFPDLGGCGEGLGS